MDHSGALQTRVLHSASHLLPPLYLRCGLHHRFHLHSKRRNFQEGDEGGPQGVEEAHVDVLMRLRCVFRLQHRDHGGYLLVGNFNRVEHRRVCGFCSDSGFVLRWVRVPHRGVATGECCDCVGGLVGGSSHVEEQGVDKGEDGVVDIRVFYSCWVFCFDKGFVQGDCGGWMERDFCGQNSVRCSLFLALVVFVPLWACCSNCDLLCLQVLSP